MSRSNPNLPRRFAAPVRAALGAALLSSLPAFAADCAAPEQPTMPDGATASMEQMLEGQKGVKAFQAGNIEYMKCLEGVLEKARAMAEKAAEGDARAIASTQYNEAFEAYNAAVSAEEAVAGAFNIELREYKAANK